MSTLLEIVNQAEGELSLKLSTSVATSSNQQSQLLFRLVNNAGRSLQRAHDWGDLITLATITTVVGQTDYAVPSDYTRMVADTGWDRANNLQMSGPDTPQTDRWRRESRTGQAGIVKTFRQIGKTYVRIFPTPTIAGQSLVYEYVSNNWAIDDDETGKSAFSADSDTTVYDFDLMVKGLKWLWKNATGQPDAEIYYNDYRQTLDQLIAADLGGGVLNMGPPAPADDFEVAAGSPPNFILTDGGDYVEFD